MRIGQALPLLDICRVGRAGRHLEKMSKSVKEAVERRDFKRAMTGIGDAMHDVQQDSYIAKEKSIDLDERPKEATGLRWRKVGKKPPEGEGFEEFQADGKERLAEGLKKEGLKNFSESAVVVVVTVAGAGAFS